MPSIEQLEKVLAVDPNDAFVHYALAQEYAKQGDYDRAVAGYDRCIELDEAYCYAYFHKAKALEAADRVGDAIDTLQTGLAVANRVGDQKAVGEIGAYLDELQTSS